LLVPAVEESVLAHALFRPPASIIHSFSRHHISLHFPSRRSHLHHSEHIHRGIQRTRGLVSASSSSGAGSTVGRSLSARVALSGALDRLVDDLDGGLGLPVRVELQVVALKVRVSAGFCKSAAAASRDSASSRRGAFVVGGAYPGARKGSIARRRSATRAVWFGGTCWRPGMGDGRCCTANGGSTGIAWPNARSMTSGLGATGGGWGS
jgi:hypothetical protein